MPANLTQQYHKAEQRYREASTPEEEFACLQEMLKEIPKHKGTDKLQADLKQKISRLKDEIAKAKSSPSRGSTKIPRQGAGRCVFIGAPNTGKSKLLSKLTRATPEIGEYPFTTRAVQPAMMPWEDVAVQIIDTPPITRDVFDPSLQNLVRGADLIALFLDLGNDDGAQELDDILKIFQNSKTRFGHETCIDENDIGVTYTKTILVANKIDDQDAADRQEFFDSEFEFPFERFVISAETGQGLDELRNAIYAAMNAIRVYTKLPTKKEPDMDKPFSLKQGSTVLDLAELIHKDIAANLKTARIWGTSVHPGTVVKGDHELQDRDVVEIQT